MALTWSSALSVIPVLGGLTIDYNFCPFGNQASSPGFQSDGVDADLVIFVTANSDVCSVTSKKVLASAEACFWDQFERPIAGVIDFCLEAMDDEAVSSAVSSLETTMSPSADTVLRLNVATAVHEITHVLGFTSSDMLFYYDSKTGLPRTPEPEEKEVTCITGDRRLMYVPDKTTLQEKTTTHGRHFEVTLPTVRQVARNQFNCQRLTGAALENQPTNLVDCFGSHWEERLFSTEALSPVLGGVPDILSSLTLGLLHDSGWYVPDYGVAEISPFGLGSGCEFVEESCIVNGEAPDYSTGMFCNTEYKFENGTVRSIVYMQASRCTD
jgi:leishmanolysin-like peptidase